ncbi:MAG: hypothetical protein JSS07_04735 [Proteobacteria bacterium]|nr:hypothetical protein [Pseudomonadota bacterium]
MQPSTIRVIQNIHKLFHQSRSQIGLFAAVVVMAPLYLLILLSSVFLLSAGMVLKFHLIITPALLVGGIIGCFGSIYFLNVFPNLDINRQILKVITCLVLAIRKKVIGIQGTENITTMEFVSLTFAFFQFNKIYSTVRPWLQATQCGFDPDRSKSYFIDFLKRTHKVDILAILVKLGANRKDCYLDFFEDLDAKSVHPEGVQSLQWLAALAVNRHRHQISLSRATSEAKAIVETSKNYVMPAARNI